MVETNPEDLLTDYEFYRNIFGTTTLQFEEESENESCDLVFNVQEGEENSEESSWIEMPAVVFESQFTFLIPAIIMIIYKCWCFSVLLAILL